MLNREGRRGRWEDVLALPWQLVTFLVYTLHDSPRSPFFFSGFRQPGFLYRSPGSAIAHRQSLSNASILGISLEAANVLCKWNGVNTRKRVRVGGGRCGQAELGAFQVPSWSGSLSFTMRQYFSLRKRHFTFIWAVWGREQQRNIKWGGTAQKKSWMWDLHTSRNTRGNSTRALSGRQGRFNLMLTAIALPEQCRVCECRFIGCTLGR